MSKVEIKKFKPTDAFLKVLLYGASGVGKTTFGITAPKPLFISAESGLLSIAKYSPEYIEVKTMAEMNAAYEFLAAGDHDYETVIIDSLTEIQNVVMTRITGPDRSPGREDWGVFSTEMAKILRRFRDLPMHVVFVCLENVTEDKDENRYYTTELYGKLAQKAAGFMDFVGRFAFYKVKAKGEDVAERKRLISFQASEEQLGKDRSGMLPRFVKPDFAAIVEAVSKIEIGTESVVKKLECKDEISTVSGDAAPKPQKEAKAKKKDDDEDEEEAKPEPTAERPWATREDLDGILQMMDDAQTEEDLDNTKLEGAKFRFKPDQVRELAEFGRMRRQAIKDGQIKLPVPDVHIEDKSDTLEAANEAFGLTPSGEDAPPAKKAPPKKKTPPAAKSTLQRMQEA